MGILSVVNRNLLPNSKSQLKHLLSSSLSNFRFIRRVSSHAAGDLKSNNNKLNMLLIEHYHHDESAGIDDSWYHLSRFPPYNYSLFSADDHNYWKLDHHNNPFSGFGNYILADSCNELMLFFLYNMNAPFCGYGEYLLWNPTIDKVKILPPQNIYCGPAFRNEHGFGFDSESEDYKLVRFPLLGHLYGSPGQEIDNEILVYSLKTNSWKKNTFSHVSDDPLQKPSVHVNGIYYRKTKSANILSFDFATERFSSAPYIPRPPKFDEHTKDLLVDDFVLVEFDGLLAALVHSELSKSSTQEEEEEEEKAFSFEVWGWNGETWLERKSRITIEVAGGGVVKVVGLFQNDKLFLQNGVGELLLFHLAESKLENLGIRADPQMVNIFPFHVRSSNPVHGK